MKIKDVMSKRADEELIKIVTISRNDYQPLAVIAAEEDIKKRKLDITKIEKIENDFKTEIEENTRFIHFIIDTIIVHIITFLLIFIMIFLLNVKSEFIESIVFLSLFLIFISYYYFMEVIFQKTIAKFITKTKVVTNNGNKPNKSDILVRTFCRLIPLDPISFLFTRNGFHDRLSNTIIIKDNKKINH